MKFKWGRCIYTSDSGIRVYDNFFYRWLTFNTSAIQTAIFKLRPQKPALYYIQPFIYALKQNPDDCCLLGLGGGGIAHALKAIKPKFSLVAVEYSVEVIKIAKQFFKVDSLDFLSIQEEDAFNFIQHTTQCFGHILVDLSDFKDKFPQTCSNIEFFLSCKEKLKPGGILVVNIANNSEHWAIYQNLRSVFGKSLILIPIKGYANLIAIASGSLKMMELVEIFSQFDMNWDTKWGWIVDFS